MSISRHAVLTAVVDIYRESGEPVRVGMLAESLGASEATLSEALDSLCECELLETTGRGYRPTVTARDLLAEDIRLEDVLVLDFVEK